MLHTRILWHRLRRRNGSHFHQSKTTKMGYKNRLYLLKKSLPLKFHISPYLFSALSSNKWHLFHIAPRLFVLFVMFYLFAGAPCWGPTLCYLEQGGKDGSSTLCLFTPLSMESVRIESFEAPYNAVMWNITILIWKVSRLRVREVKLGGWGRAHHGGPAWCTNQPDFRALGSSRPHPDSGIPRDLPRTAATSIIAELRQMLNKWMKPIPLWPHLKKDTKTDEIFSSSENTKSVWFKLLWSSESLFIVQGKSPSSTLNKPKHVRMSLTIYRTWRQQDPTDRVGALNQTILGTTVSCTNGYQCLQLLAEVLCVFFSSCVQLGLITSTQWR